ncbi:hypothetical protein J0A68_18740 [Algoriphagus sp. H41]|uniref:Uncharacterized protein n=1 Tax=Algoriphagus oliviformis TaxID=2811231 RepID=A0ABS3CA17_9BACT|nr:hypothetical protein [Algoriphagus oliviformis]MBN7813001.1 hypothetical protein [Algoriphagus oliviformis]
MIEVKSLEIPVPTLGIEYQTLEIPLSSLVIGYQSLFALACVSTGQSDFGLIPWKNVNPIGFIMNKKWSVRTQTTGGFGMIINPRIPKNGSSEAGM